MSLSPGTTEFSSSCPRCASTHIVRNGHRSGHQRFLCHGCKRTFGQTTVPDSGGIRLFEQHAAFLRLCDQPFSLRSIAQQLGVALSTAFRWRHAYLRKLEQEEPPPRKRLSGTVLVLFSSVTSTKVMPQIHLLYRTEPPPDAMACFPVFTYGRLLAGAIVHIMQVKSGRVVDQVCRYFSGFPGRAGLARMITQHAEPGTCVLSPLGRGIVQEDTASPPGAIQQGSTKVKWLTGTLLARYAPRIEEVIYGKAAKRSSERHRIVFRRWMRSFRGIALRYAGRYTAWFSRYWGLTHEDLGLPDLRL